MTHCLGSPASAGHDISFGRGHWCSTPIITNLLDLEAISWKQTAQTSLVLKHGSPKKIAHGAPLFQSSSKAGWLPWKKGAHCFCRRSLQQRPASWVFYWLGYTQAGLAITGRGKHFSASAYTQLATCSVLSQGLKIQSGCPLTFETRCKILRNVLKPPPNMMEGDNTQEWGAGCPETPECLDQGDFLSPTAVYNPGC